MITAEKLRKRKTSRLLNLALVLFVTAASLWLADLVFKVYERNRLLPKMPDINATGPVNLAALSYNDGLVQRQSAEGEFRILSFGDSFTYSVMEPKLSYGGVLQDRLDQSFPEYRFRVINLGEPATGNRHFRAAHEFWSQVFEHDAVLFHIFLGNDVLDDAYMYSSVVWAPNDAVLKGGNPVLDAANARVPRKYPLRMLDYAYAYWMSAKTKSAEALPQGYNWAGLTSFEPEIFSGINFEYLQNFDPAKMPDLLPGYEQVYLLLKQAQLISDSGKKVAIALGPSQPQVDDGLRASVLADHGADAGSYDMELPVRIIRRLQEAVAPDVPLFDMTADFREVRQQSGEKLFFRRNTHWDREGNRLAGHVIADQLRSGWFGGTAPLQKRTEVSYRNELVSHDEIDAYLAPLTGTETSGQPTVTGAVRSVHLFDGITGQPGNWAIAALNQAVLVEFESSRDLSALRLHLYGADSRQYRFTVEVQLDDGWQTVSDHSVDAVGGMQDINLGLGPVSAIRITGLFNSSQVENPDNAFLHIEELELID